MARSISGTPRTGIRGLTSPNLRSLLPFPAAMIRHFMPLFSINAVDEGFGHAMGLVIRCMKLALTRKEGGILYAPSAYFCKHPPRQFTDDEAYRLTERYIVEGEDMMPDYQAKQEQHIK
ncbi:hypothetical protein ES703_123131 [subsurface metagenome]